ncbi:hypothetical protein [Pleomorphomonas carboxyditropha]|uniref:Uncharacterized protein n=1 Tax=Pleomorphomonas carboxyditropha TaxID=2023338 RepID=A0A2G9X0X5_9HYPH|nr:hypothetical protein [Pleomorphomonas carboxyditropha]PIP00585.1 hypothetical protein CJ014_00315 [Pleomorphomonas carboxyditropha]
MTAITMNTIGSTSYFTFDNRYSAVNRPESPTDFANQLGSETASTTKPEADKLTSLLAQLEELKKHQLNMSINDYLLANFTLKEQISTERLNAGEDLDHFGVNFEGRTFKLAGKVFGPDSLGFAKIPDSGTLHLEPGNTVRSYLEQGAGVDIKI